MSSQETPLPETGLAQLNRDVVASESRLDGIRAVSECLTKIHAFTGSALTGKLYDRQSPDDPALFSPKDEYKRLRDTFQEHCDEVKEDVDTLRKTRARLQAEENHLKDETSGIEEFWHEVRHSLPVQRRRKRRRRGTLSGFLARMWGTVVGWIPFLPRKKQKVEISDEDRGIFSVLDAPTPNVSNLTKTSESARREVDSCRRLLDDIRKLVIPEVHAECGNNE